ncbi:MAG TPA: MCE family protein [Jatrophihabitans sp.]|jgi:phospholipid/cholesterol/gamma-HCH transport system substrate-binding protein|uniref:MCE family protein n=1 Tax=Jatrophihabitans sp. TaxID=1932789 RepID=UPI002DF99DCA|nr:MCE family protein [Jatrophihabitans sp.]
MRAALGLVLVAITLSGCSVGLEDLPAPAGTSGPTYRVTAAFGDVQNLALGAKVKDGGALIGEVTSIDTHDYVAEVGLTIEKTFVLGRDARFQIRFTTPLGEDFIAVTPGTPARGTLADGASVPLSETSNAPSIEDTFAAVSALLNGGGLAKLQTIATELDRALHGRTGNARDALVQLQRVIGNLDAHKGDIDRTLNGLAAMAKALNQGNGVVTQALALFPPTLQTLADDTGRVRELLTRVARLGSTVDGLLARSQGALLADLDNLRPTLDALRARQNELIPAMRSLSALGRAVQHAAPGDYVKVSATVEFLLNAPPARPDAGGNTSAAAPRDATSTLLSGSLP